MREPLVTIVTPSYNQGEFIRATIESVLGQDYPHVEYIIMDGGSTDGTASVVAEYASRLTWISEKDRGQSHAINKGFRMARGEILAWLNSDDVFLPGAITAAVCAFERNPSLGAIYGEGYTIGRTGAITGRFPHTVPFNLWKLVYLSDYILQQASFFRKAVIEEVGYVDENLHYGLDWDLFIRIGSRYMIEQIPEYLGCIREYAEAKSFAGGIPRVKELRRLLRGHTGLRFPPGYIVYGLDTYAAVWCDWIKRWTPGALRRPGRLLEMAVRFCAGYVISRTIRESQGWYSDGWATTTVHFMLARVASAVVLRGTLPGDPRLEGQEISVYCDGQLIHRAPVACGDFTITFPLPGPAGSAATLKFRASRFVKGGRTDRRRLAYLLKSVEPAPSGSLFPIHTEQSSGV